MTEKHFSPAIGEFALGKLASRRGRIFAAVDAERERQTEKWPGQWSPGATSPEKKLAILVEEVGEIAKEVLEGGEKHPSLREELVQGAAVCFAWLESLDAQGDPDAR